jgi:hypothetical protein
LSRLNSEWSKKYYKIEEEEVKKMSFNTMPTLQQFWHCLAEFDGKITNHTDFLIAYYKLLSKYTSKVQTRYHLVLKQLSICYILVYLSGEMNPRDRNDDGTFKIPLKSISESEVEHVEINILLQIKLFND